MRVLAALFLLVYFVPANGEGVFQAEPGNGVRVVLHNEPCKLKEVVNLPFRATWHEAGKEIEGCFGPRPDAGIVVFYFADKTVGIAPIDAFKRITGV